jgi:hypothetical protein
MTKYHLTPTAPHPPEVGNMILLVLIVIVALMSLVGPMYQTWMSKTVSSGHGLGQMSRLSLNCSGMINWKICLHMFTIGNHSVLPRTEVQIHSSMLVTSNHQIKIRFLS